MKEVRRGCMEIVKDPCGMVVVRNRMKMVWTEDHSAWNCTLKVTYYDHFQFKHAFWVSTGSHLHAKMWSNKHVDFLYCRSEYSCIHPMNKKPCLSTCLFKSPSCLMSCWSFLTEASQKNWIGDFICVLYVWAQETVRFSQRNSVLLVRKKSTSSPDDSLKIAVL